MPRQVAIESPSPPIIPRQPLLFSRNSLPTIIVDGETAHGEDEHNLNDYISTAPRDKSMLDAIAVAVAVASVGLVMSSAVKVVRDQFQFPDC